MRDLVIHLPNQACGRPLGNRITTRVVVVLVFLLLGAPSSRAQFPGPVTLDQAADALCALPLDLEPGALDYLACGTADGALTLYRFNPGSSAFSFQGRVTLGGRVVAVAPWEGRPVGDQGLVVATADPDRLHFLDVGPEAPALVQRFWLDLPEDPGTIAYGGDPGVGTRELAVTLPGLDRVLIYVPDGDGWRLDQELPAGDRPEVILGVDLDGDQVRELVAANRGPLSGTLGVWRRDPGGVYRLETLPFAPGRPVDLAKFDIDGDGRDELYATVEDVAQVAQLAEQGGQLVVTGLIDLELPGEALTLDRLYDGSPALWTTNRERGLVTFLRYDGSAWERRASYYPGCQPEEIVTANLNGDDARDLFCVGGDWQVFTGLLANAEPGYWGVPAISLTGSPGPSTTGDFDGDGLDDLVLLLADQPLLNLYRALPEGGYATTPLVRDLGFFAVDAIEFQADGDAPYELAVLDILARQAVILDFDPAEGWTETSRTDLGAAPVRSSRGDVDGDGRADLLVLVRDQTELRVLYGAGDGTFEAVGPVGFGGFADRVVALDLNADGLLELAATDGNSRVWLLQNQGGRSFDDISFLNAGTGALDMATGDLDGDGDDDLVSLNVVEESLSFFENDGQGGLVRRVGALAVGRDPVGLAIGDLDRNGVNEVVVNLPGDRILAGVYRLSPWNYSNLVPLGSAPNLASFRITDINLDDMPDLLAMDKSLSLGLAMLNVTQDLVAAERSPLEAACEDDGLEIRVNLPGGEPWLLEAHDGAVWSTLAVDGRSTAWAVDFEAGSWFLQPALEAVSVAGDLRLRLSWGLPGDTRVEMMDVRTPCTEAPTAALSLLAWDREPWPNPFNPRVNARFTLARAAAVRVGVYDLAGRLVADLATGPHPAGAHTVTWDGRGSAGTAGAGVYFLRVDTPEQVLSRKVMLLK